MSSASVLGSVPLTSMPLTTSTSAGLAFAVSQMKTGSLRVFDSELSSLYLQATPTAHLGFDTSAFTSLTTSLPNSTQTIGGQSYVTIDVTAHNGIGASLLSGLDALGLTGGSAYAGVASGAFPVSQLGALSTFLAGGSGGQLGFASASGYMVSAGLVDTQADQAEHADQARADYGVDGTGVTVGILSDSFNTNASASTHMAQDIASGDLPANTTILQDYPKGTDEGRAMGQLVHDLAPGAAIDFATGEGGEANMANNIIALANAGAKVIVDDLMYFNELAYQEGPIAQAVDQVAAQGVSYFSAAGNNSYGSNVTGYEGAWSTGATYTGGGETTTLMHFAPGQDYIPVTLASRETIVLQWANPGASAGGSGATSDLDLFLTNQSGSVVYASSETNNIGGDPVESISLSGGTGQTYYLRVGLYAGAAPPEIKLMALSDGLNVSFTSPASNTNTGTFYGHAAAEGAMGVGASSFLKTPAFGKNVPIIDNYSSGGPDNILFDTSGHALATAQVSTPAFVAVDGGNTTFFGRDIPQDADSYPNFSGTSAAAPDAAAVAALMLQASPTLTPSQIETLLQDSATDMGTKGFDARTGAGLINADLAVGSAATQHIVSSQQVITGINVNETITGSSAANTIYGGTGNDTIIGGGGADILWGGAGANTFVYQAASDSTVSVHGQDQIMDFSDAQGDRIDLSAISPSFSLVAKFTKLPDQLIELTKPGGYLVEGDINGDGKADFGIFVHATSPLTASDFVL